MTEQDEPCTPRDNFIGCCWVIGTVFMIGGLGGCLGSGGAMLGIGISAMMTSSQKPDECKPCNGCPWTSTAERDRIAITDELKKAAATGMWFCCHVNMGTCYGAARFAQSKAAVPATERESP